MSEDADLSLSMADAGGTPALVCPAWAWTSQMKKK